MASQYAELEQLAVAAKGECLKQFQQLMQAASLGLQIQQTVVASRLRVVPQTPTLPIEVKAVTPRRRKSRKQSRKSKKTKPLSEHGNVAVQIDLLLSKAKGPKAYAGAKLRAIKELGLSGREFTHNRNLKVAQNFTQTKDSRRGNFIRRALASGVTLDTLKQIAAAYEKLGYGAVTVEELKMEANKAKG